MKKKNLWAVAMAAIMVAASLTPTVVYADDEAGEGTMAESVALANGDPISFTPLKQTGSNGKNVLYEVFETLVDQDGVGGDVYGCMAKDWYMDGNDLYVEIYDYIYDSEGNHITADDVVFSYDYSWDNGYTTSLYKTYTDGVEKVDDYKVVFHWKEEKLDAYFGIESVLLGQFIFSQAAFEESPDEMATDPVGTGPYILNEFVPGSHAVLEARENYWQTDESLVGPQHRQNVKNITYKFISDSAQISNALKVGAVDFADAVDEASIGNFQNSDDWTIVSGYDNKLLCAFFNCLEGTPLADSNLRAALCYAINSDDILAALGGEEYARKVYEYSVPDVLYYNADCENWDSYYNVADLDLAQEYLSKSDYAGDTLQLYYNAAEFGAYAEACSLCIGAACEQLGIPYEIHPVNQIEDIISTTNGDWNIVVMTIGGDGAAVDYMRNNFNSTRYEGLLGNYYDDDLEALYAKTYSASGATEENVSEFNKYLIDHYYVYGLAQCISNSVMKSGIITDCAVRTRRNYTLPGSWEYVQ